MNINSAINTLEECEKGLRKALVEAGEAGDYGNVRRIMGWAETIASITATAKRDAAAPHPTASTSTVPNSPRPSSKNKTVDEEYPRFQRRGDELVKIGWSKSDRKEYNHRAPKKALDALVVTLKKVAPNGSGFTSEDLNPLKDIEAGGVFPTYQVFVALAWLRKLGLVKQHGRKGGYTLVPDLSLEATITNAWPELPTWRG